MEKKIRPRVLATKVKLFEGDKWRNERPLGVPHNSKNNPKRQMKTQKEPGGLISIEPLAEDLM